MTERNKAFKQKVIKLARAFIESKREEIIAADSLEDARKRDDYYPGMRAFTHVRVAYPPEWEREWKMGHRTHPEHGGEVAYDFLQAWERQVSDELEAEYYEKWNLDQDRSPRFSVRTGYWDSHLDGFCSTRMMRLSDAEWDALLNRPDSPEGQLAWVKSYTVIIP